MRTSLYFVNSALPPITLDERCELSFRRFVLLIEENLSRKAIEAQEAIRRLVDLYNLAAFWRDLDIDDHGNLTRREIEEAVGDRENLPDYILDFLEEHPGNEERLRAHGELVAEFYQHQIGQAKGFLKSYLEFERAWRLVLVGFRAKQLERDVSIELQYEDPTDELVAYLLAQKDAPFFEPPEGFEQLKPIFESYAVEPWQYYRALEEVRFQKVKEMVQDEVFTLDFTLGYMVQLMIAEKWFALKEQHGEHIAS